MDGKVREKRKRIEVVSGVKDSNGRRKKNLIMPQTTGKESEMLVETEYREACDYWRAYEIKKTWYGYKRLRSFWGTADTEEQAIENLKFKIKRREQKGSIYEF
jgi:hypothetical protein